MKYYIITPDDREFICLASSPEQAVFCYWRFMFLRNKHHAAKLQLAYQYHCGQADETQTVSSQYAAMVYLYLDRQFVISKLIRDCEPNSLLRFLEEIEEHTGRPIGQI